MITLFCVRPKGFNVGNDAIYIGLQQFLYAAFGQVVNLISLPATSRYESQAKSGLTAKTVHEINQYGHGVIVGGGNLYENGELDVNLDALDSLEVPLMLFSLSGGRIYNRMNELVRRTDAMPARVIKALNDKAVCSLVRDDSTMEYLHGIGCTNSIVGGCPTIYLGRIAGRLPGLHEPDRGIAFVSVRNPAIMNVPLPKQSRVFGDVKGIISLLRDAGHRDIRLLCHDYRDIPFAASFDGVDYVYTGDVYYYLSLLRECSINVSYRLHATLPCMSFGTPNIQISYDERAISLTDTLGLGEWNINMVHSDDVAGQVAGYLGRMDDLDKVRERAGRKWEALHGVTTGAFADFAAEVRSCHEKVEGRKP